MHVRIAVCLLLALILAGGCVTAPERLHPTESASRDIDALLAQVLRDVPDIPGIGVAVVRDGKPYYANAVGLADREKGTRANALTGYYIASSTKSYTGLACAILANRGVLNLDAPIVRYLPEVTAEAGKLTLREFLTHTAPVTNDPIVIRTAFTGEHTPALLTQLLNSSKPRKDGFQYGNLGYVVASMVIERVTGKPWQQVIDEAVFAPLGMHDTTALISEASRRQLAVPYDVDRRGEMRPLAFVKNDQMMHAAGGIVTTPADLARWLAANVNDGRIDGSQRLPAAAFAEAHRQQAAVTIERDAFKSSGYGFGWYQAQYGADSVLFHLGGFEGWSAHVSFMPAKKLGVAVVANAGGLSGRVLNDVAACIYDRLLEKPDANASCAARLVTLKADLQRQRERMAADIEARSKRPWMLAHRNGAYTGRYENPLYGAITIEEDAEKLVASLANLRADLEAFTEPESARVELLPGSGSVLRFQVDGDVVTSLQWNDEVFHRTR